MARLPKIPASIASAAALLAATSALAAEPDFSHKVAKVVAGYDAGRSTLANFPVLVRIPAATAAECRADGADIRFSSPDGEAEYPHEIDAWNPSGESTVWVLLPEMRQGTVFVMEWGDPGYAGPETPWAKGAVWDPAGYAGVWHMTEESGNVANSTSKTGVGGVALDAIPSGARAAYSARSSDAKIGYARDTGAQDVNHDSSGRAFLRVPNYDNLEIGDKFAISGWWKITDYHGNYDNTHRTRNGRMFSRKTAWSSTGGFEFALNNSTTAGSIAGGASGNNDPKVAMSGFASSQGNWVHMAFVFNGSTATPYVNGVSRTGGTISPATDCGLDLGFGSNVGQANGVYNNDSYVVGLFDEMRLQPLRSDIDYADWFAAEYAMGADSAFLEDRAISQETPSVSISIDSATSREWHDESLTITLSRSSDAAWSTISVNMSYTGTASLVATMPATITMPAGETSVTLEIPVSDNDELDGDRSLTATVLAGTGYDVGAASSVSLTIIDDETHAQVCEWTGGGDGASWGDAANWSSQSVPTEIDTALFGDGVAGNLAVAMAEDATARIVRVTAQSEVTIGAAAAPTVGAIDIDVAEGAGIVRVASKFAIGGTFTVTVGDGASLYLNDMEGDGDLVKKGAGLLRFRSAANRSGGTTCHEAGRIEFGGDTRLFGGRLEIGGKGEPAVAFCTFANGWNFSPFSNQSGELIVKDGGVFDLTTNNNSPLLQTLSAVRVEHGGTLNLGNTIIKTSGGGDNFYIEGTVTGSAASGLQMQSGNIAVPATAEGKFVMDGGVAVRTGHFAIEDNPALPVEMVLNGTIESSNWPKSDQDGIVKQGDGVLRLTAASDFGGASNWQGTTAVNGGTLLLDNAAGSATGKSWVFVNAGGTLGGTGRAGGLADSGNARLTVAGSASAPATVAPGTIDDTTGAHVCGTLTVGSEEQSAPVAFGSNSKLRVTVAGHGQADSLRVFGSIDLSGATDALEIVLPEGVDAVRGGTYLLVSATEGITGEFDSIVNQLPNSRLVIDENGISIVCGSPTVIILH
ncbi:MAG: hypothetical protein IJ783_06545 [Kiritimatiellae bacterium]|nr:hypothetical protein [Kiritimatiellia bacterium]